MQRHLLNILSFQNNSNNDHDDNDNENNDDTNNNNNNNNNCSSNSTAPGCSASTVAPAARQSLQSGVNYENTNNNNNLFVQFSSVLPIARQMRESNASIPSQEAIRKEVTAKFQKNEKYDDDDDDDDHDASDCVNHTSGSTALIAARNNMNTKDVDDEEDDEEEQKVQNISEDAKRNEASVLLIPRVKDVSNVMGSGNMVNDHHLREATTEIAGGSNINSHNHNNNNNINSSSAKTVNNNNNKTPGSFISLDYGARGAVVVGHESITARSVVSALGRGSGSSVQQQEQNHQQGTSATASPATATPASKRVSNDDDNNSVVPVHLPLPPLVLTGLSNQKKNNNNNNNNHDDKAKSAKLPIIEKSFFHAAFVAPVQPVAGSLLEENSTRVIRKVLAKLEKINTKPLFTGTVEVVSLDPKKQANNDEKNKADNGQQQQIANNNNNDANKSDAATASCQSANTLEQDKSKSLVNKNEKGNNNDETNNEKNNKQPSRTRRRRSKCGVTDRGMNQIFFGKNPKTGKIMEKQAEMLFVTTGSNRFPDSFSRNSKDNNNNNDDDEIARQQIEDEQQQKPLTSPRSQHRESTRQQKQELIPPIAPSPFLSDDDARKKIFAGNRQESPSLNAQQQRRQSLNVKFSDNDDRTSTPTSSGQHQKITSNFSVTPNNDNNNGLNHVASLMFPSSPMKTYANNMNRNDSLLSPHKATMIKIPINSDVKPSQDASCEPSTAENEEANAKNNFTSSISNFFVKFHVRCTLLNPLVHRRCNSAGNSTGTGRTFNNNNNISNNFSTTRPPQSQSRRKTRISPTIVQVVNNNNIDSRRNSPSKNTNNTSPLPLSKQPQPIHKIYLPPQSSSYSSSASSQKITGVMALPGMPLKVMTTTNDFVFTKRFKSIQQVQQILQQNNNNHDHLQVVHELSSGGSTKSMLLRRGLNTDRRSAIGHDSHTNNNNNIDGANTVIDILENDGAFGNGLDCKISSNAFLSRVTVGGGGDNNLVEKELSSVGTVTTRSTVRHNAAPVASEKRKIPSPGDRPTFVQQNASSDGHSTQVQHLFSRTTDNNNNNSKKCSESTNTNNIINHENLLLLNNTPFNNIQKKSVGFIEVTPSARKNDVPSLNRAEIANEHEVVVSIFADSPDNSFSSSYIICDEEDEDILQLKKPTNATVLDVHDANLREAVEVGSASYLNAFLESSPSAFDGSASSLGRYCGTFQPVVQLGKGAFGTAYLVVYKENEKLLQDHQKNNAAPEPVHTAADFIANHNHDDNNNTNRRSLENQQQLVQCPTPNTNNHDGFSLNNFSLVVSGAAANNNNTYLANDTSAVHTNNIITDFAALVRRQSRPENQSINLPSLVGSASFHALTPRALANFRGCGASFNIPETNNNNTNESANNNNNNNDDDNNFIPRASKRQFGFYNPAGELAVKEIFGGVKRHDAGTCIYDNNNLTVNSISSAAASRLPVTPPPSLPAWNNNNNSNNNIFKIQNIPQSPSTPLIPMSKTVLPSIFLSPAEQTSVVPRALRKKLLLPIAGPAGGVSGMAATTEVLTLSIRDKQTGLVNPTQIRREDLFVCKVEQLPDPEVVKRKNKHLVKQQHAPWDSDFDVEGENSGAVNKKNEGKNPLQRHAARGSPEKNLLLGAAVDSEKKKLLAMEANKKRLERMQNEAHILSNIAHPNIVAFIDYYLDKKTNQQLLFLEYVDGGDLQKEIEKRSMNQPRQYFSIDSVLHIFVQIVLAVEYLHRHNILHRDIKPQNILLSKHYFAKLTDFGTSKQFDQDVDGLVDTKLAGTPLYLSPEIVANKPYSQKSDIWALGVLLIELLSFGFPFDGATYQELCQNIQFRPPRPLRRPGPQVPQEILELAGRMLHKDPDMRPTAKNILTDFACIRNAAVYYDKRVCQFIKSSSSTPVDAAWLTVLRDHFKLIYGHDANVTSQQSRARDSMLRGSVARERSYHNMSSAVPMRMSIVNLTSSQQMKKKQNGNVNFGGEGGERVPSRSATLDSVKSYHYFQTFSPRRRHTGARSQKVISAGASAVNNTSGVNGSATSGNRTVGEASF